MTTEPTYDRPVKARLMVVLDNGEKWEATDADLDRFRLVDQIKAYSRVTDMLREGLGIESFDDHPAANAIRYLIECGICYDHSPWADENGKPWDAEDEPDDTRDLLRAALLGTTP